MKRSTWVVIVALVLVVESARAQEDPVEAALRRGTELRRGGRDEEALVEYRRAYELQRAPRTAALYGIVAQATGRWLDADALLREALAAPDDPWIARNRASLEESQRQVARRIGSLELRANVDGARVEVDGVSRGTLPMAEALRVIAGTLHVVVRAEGRVSIERRVVVEPGIVTREFFDLVEVTPEPPPPPPPPLRVVAAPPVVASIRPVAPVDRGAPLRFVGYGALALGGVSMIFGAVGLALRESAAERYNGECPPLGAGLSSRCTELVDSERTWGAIGAVVIPVGAVITAAGAILLWRGVVTSRNTALRCAPGIGSVACAVRF